MPNAHSIRRTSQRNEPFGHGASFGQKQGPAFKKDLVLAHPSWVSGVFRCIGTVKGRQQRPFGSTLCAQKTTALVAKMRVQQIDSFIPYYIFVKEILVLHATP
jgi:hypothetical protein